MKSLGDKLFTGAGFAEDQDGAIDLGGALDFCKDVLHRLGCTDDLIEAEFLVESAAQVVDFLVFLRPSRHGGSGGSARSR